MLRSALAVVIGLFVMLLMLTGLQSIGRTLWPPPAGLDLTHPAAWEALFNMLPTVALTWVLFAYAAAAFFGAGTAATISVAHKRGSAMVIGVVVLALAAVIFMSLPHPGWMVVTGLLLPLPCAWLGWRLFR